MSEMITDSDAEVYREHMLRRARELDPAQNASLALSGGVDSATALFAMLETGRRPRCYTFYVEGVYSDDLKSSRRMAEHFGLELVEVMIPWDLKQLERDVRKMIPHAHVIKKTVIQCLHPWLYICPAMKDRGDLTIITGLGGDDLFGTQRKVMQMRNVEGEQAVRDAGYRKVYSDDLDFSNANIIRYCDTVWKIACSDIYFDRDLETWFYQHDLKSLHTPFEKAASILAFKDYYGQGPFRRGHASYQVNSKLRELHDVILADGMLNARGSKVVVSVYNDIAKGLV